MRPVARAAALLLVAPFLLFVSALAPEHVHEAADHDHAVAHSHFDLHHPDAHTPHGVEIEHGDHDSHVVWLDGAVLHQAPYRVSAGLAALPAGADAIAFDVRWFATASDDLAPAHGPPRRVPFLRGPPPLLV